MMIAYLISTSSPRMGQIDVLTNAGFQFRVLGNIECMAKVIRTGWIHKTVTKACVSRC